ncbi:MAG TPA: TasA family protein [Candidatus Acidoferrales bacterium]|nr:TasA family protein [Candidatus Acidoferrales bacterium]
MPFNTKFKGDASIMTRKKKGRVLAAMLALGALSAVFIAGSYALFNAKTSTGGNLFNTGTLAMGNSNGATATATMSNMIPGDSVSGTVTVQNTGSEDITAYQLSTAVTAASPGNPNLLTTDTTNGLQLWVSRCSQAWTGTGAAATCGGMQTDVLGTNSAPMAILTSGSSLSANALCTSSASVTAAIRAARGTTCSITGSDYLKFQVSLPTTADNTFQGLSTTLSFTFQGQQATAANF